MKKNTCAMTVNGPIQCDSMGFCHSHEHLFMENIYLAGINPDLYIGDMVKTSAELELFKKIGGTTIVDAQPLACGRMEEKLVSVSKSTGVHIIASTGFHKLSFYPSGHWIHNTASEEIASLFISEIREGMLVDNGNNLPTRRIEARAGVIKTAADVDGITEDYLKLFKAAVRASKETGAPILCHTEMGRHALDIVNYFTASGIPPESVILCHVDRVINDLNYFLEILNKGVFLEFDTIGRCKYHTDEAEARLIAFLVGQGYGNKILLGLDTTRRRMRSYGGNIGLDYIQATFLPLLKSYGISNESIDKFMIKNPAKAFCIK